MRMIYISLFMLFIMMNNKEKVKDKCIYMYLKKTPNAKISKPFDILWLDGLDILFLLHMYVFVHRRWL